MKENILHGGLDGYSQHKASYEKTGRLLGEIFAKFSLDADLDTIQLEVSRIATELRQDAGPPELGILLVQVAAAMQARLRKRNSKRLLSK